MIPWGWLIVAALGGAAVVYVLWACCVCSGRCSDDEERAAQCERCRAKREAACEACQERIEQRIQQHGRQRYLQALEDAGVTARKVYMEEGAG